MFLLKYDFCRASNYIILIKRRVLANGATDFTFFSISEAKWARFFSIKGFFLLQFYISELDYQRF